MGAGIFPRLSGGGSLAGSDLRASDLTAFSRSSLGLGRESTPDRNSLGGGGIGITDRNSLGLGLGGMDLLGEAGVARMSEERLSLGNAELTSAELKERGSDSWVPAGMHC